MRDISCENQSIFVAHASACRSRSRFEHVVSRVAILGPPLPSGVEHRRRGGSDAAPERTGGVSRRLFWMALFMGLLLAGSVGWGLLLLNREAVRLSHPATGNLVGVGVQSLRQAWVVPSNAEHFPEGATGAQADPARRVGDQPSAPPKAASGIASSSMRWPPVARTDESLRAIYIERACSNVEVHLNGEVLYRGGRMTDPYARHCYRSHVVTLPSALLKARGNAARPQGGGLSAGAGGGPPARRWPGVGARRRPGRHPRVGRGPGVLDVDPRWRAGRHPGRDGAVRAGAGLDPSPGLS